MEIDPTHSRPVAESERIATLDVLRGFAIFGIFVVNIPFLSLPLFVSMDSQRLADAPVIDQFAWLLTKGLFEIKFISLFSILFGVGLILQMTRLESRGAAFLPVYLRRLFVLAVIGVLHGLLIWYGDILFMYAIAGVVLMNCRSLSVRWLLLIGAVCFALGGALHCGFLNAYADGPQMQVAIEEPPALPSETVEPQEHSAADDRWERFTDALERSRHTPGHPAWSEAETIAYKEGPFLAALGMRAFSFFIGHIIVAGVLVGYFPRIIGLFLLGAALMKLNFFAAEKRRWHVSCLLIGVLIGLPLEVGVAASYPAAQWNLAGIALLGEMVHYFSSLALTIGYIGAICLIVHGGLLRGITGALAAVGRMALTNYIGQSVIATFIMYWWGLAMFGEFTPAQQLGLVMAIFAGQIVLSVIWLRHFTMGPLEWLWRAATYGHLPAIIRRG